MSTEKKALDGVNTLTIDDDGGVTSTLMHVPNKMSTEKDREVATEYGDKWEKEFCFEGITKAETADNVSQIFLKGIQHARQRERERMIHLLCWHEDSYSDEQGLASKVDEFLEQEAR